MPSPYIGYIVCSFLKLKGKLELIVVDCEGMIRHTNKSFLASMQCFACHSFVGLPDEAHEECTCSTKTRSDLLVC